MIRKPAIACLCILLATLACKEKYVARTKYPVTGYLVVEGFVDAAAGDTTSFRLSRTTALDTAFYRAASGAIVSVESSDNQSWPLSESGNGWYRAPVPVNPALHYRVRISSGGRNYLSDYVPVRITPPIDSVHWEEKNNGVQIDVSSHDPAGQTIYYKWGFNETWKYHSRYNSVMIWENDSLKNRTDSQRIYYCWKTDTASTILLASTEKLSSDVAARQPLTFIPFSAPFNKLIIRYSILVNEAALTKEEYQWYEKLKKNTESLGSIFDAQPSDITGNIRSLTDSTEPVIGFVACRTQTYNRIFISRDQLTVTSLSSGDEYCTLDTVKNMDPVILAGLYSDGTYLPVYIITAGRAIAGIGSSAAICVDCQVKGGVLQRPYFWID